MLRFSVREAQASFFDRPAVQRALDRTTRRSLSHGGGLVRKIGRRSIRKAPAGKVSRPGQPPFSHPPHLLRDKIFYAWDPATNSLVIGPAKLNKPGSAPATLEQGGEGTILLRGRRRQDGSREPTVVRRARFKARPYMAPALAKAAPKLAEMFRDQLGK